MKKYIVKFNIAGGKTADITVEAGNKKLALARATKELAERDYGGQFTSLTGIEEVK